MLSFGVPQRPTPRERSEPSCVGGGGGGGGGCVGRIYLWNFLGV